MRHAPLLAVLLPFAALSCSGNPPSTTTTQPRTSTAEAEHPWPECKPILAWLNRELADPTGLEVIEWKSRTARPEYKRVDILMRYRAKNRVGGMSVWHHAFQVNDDGSIRSGNAVEH